MNLKKNLLFGPALLTVAFQAGAAPAQPDAPHPRVVPHAVASEASGVAPLNAANLNVEILALLRQLKTEAVAPRGMVVCEDAYSQKLCRAGLGNGDFEYPNHAESLAGWVLEAGAYSPRPYLGSTSASRVLAMPGKNARAVSGVLLPQVSTSGISATHNYTVRLRARGSGPMPAEIGVNLMRSGVNAGEDVRTLAATKRSVGWNWVDIEFTVESIVDPSQALMLVSLERMDGNTPTMLWVDDVRIIRTPKGVTPGAE
jgi:hypothetical protein